MERKSSVDVLRILSALAVIMIHIVSAPVENAGVEINMALLNSLDLIHELMNWSVPVFFMITGYCLLRKSEVTYQYCFSHVLKYVCVLFTIGLAYALMEEIFTTKTINFSIFVESVLNVIKGDLWDHMWFVYEIIGIYLVMPVIHNFMQQGTRNILILTALLFVFNILFYQTNEYFRVGVNIPFTGYLFYVCFGGAVAKLKVNKKLAYLAYLTGIVSLIYIIICSEKQQMGYKDWAVCAMAMSVFVAVGEMEIKSNKAIHCIAKCTWGIYLIHPFFINVIIKLIKIDLLTSSPYIKLFLFAVVVSLISFISTYILRKIPLVKKLF